MDEEIFDESKLFSAFDSVKSEDKNMLVHSRQNNETGSVILSELETLKQENLVLKKLVRSIGYNPSEDEPFANILFCNGSSQGKQAAFEDFVLWYYDKNKFGESSETLSKRNMISDAFAAALGRVSDYSKLEYEELEYDVSSLPVGCVKYYPMYCLDKFGSDFEKIYPTPPTYDQVYFKTLPEDAKISQRRKQVCFNCDGDHKLNDCPKRRDLARISAKRKEFLGTRNESRYHEDQAKAEQYQHLVPGNTSKKLREALGMVDHDLPPYIYRMRMLGYPPGWLPGNQDSGIVMYGEEGREENNKGTHGNPDKYIHFPGFNVPVLEGNKDLSQEVRLPVMQPRDQLQVKIDGDRTENHKRKLSCDDSPYQNNKRVRKHSESDMDVEYDPEESPCLIETTHSSNTDMSVSKHTELEDGEIADSPGLEQNGEQCWWLKEPLVAHLSNNTQELSPPPYPLRALPLHKISQILPGELNHISAEDRSRWLDPVFGNLQVRTGRYDKLKTILATRENKRKSL